MRQLYAIGDIHGEIGKLRDLLAQIEARRFGGEPQTIVFLGDYVDRGPDSKAVIETLMAGPSNPEDTWIYLKGNHEDLMINACYQTNDVAAVNWMNNGGMETAASYGEAGIGRAHVEWMNSLPFYHETENHIFVHAGFMPFIELENQQESVCIWIRNRFFDAPMGRGFEGWKYIVHGHTPRGGPDIQPWRVNLDTGACFGGALTAALFDRDKPGTPVDILQAN